MANVALNCPTNAEVPSTPPPPDEPFLDMTAYGAGPNDSITDATENAAITRHAVTISGTTIPYTARAGHLITSSSQANAKLFYVEAERLCGLEIDDEFEFRLLLDWDALGPQRDLVAAARPREACRGRAPSPRPGSGAASDCPENRYHPR